jgi:hypothetical protein
MNYTSAQNQKFIATNCLSKSLMIFNEDFSLIYYYLNHHYKDQMFDESTNISTANIISYVCKNLNQIEFSTIHILSSFLTLSQS